MVKQEGNTANPFACIVIKNFLAHDRDEIEQFANVPSIMPTITLPKRFLLAHDTLINGLTLLKKGAVDEGIVGIGKALFLEEKVFLSSTAFGNQVLDYIQKAAFNRDDVKYAMILKYVIMGAVDGVAVLHDLIRDYDSNFTDEERHRIYFLLGAAHANAGEWKKAIQVFQKAMEMSNDNELLYYVAVCARNIESSEMVKLRKTALKKFLYIFEPVVPLLGDSPYKYADAFYELALDYMVSQKTAKMIAMFAKGLKAEAARPRFLPPITTKAKALVQPLVSLHMSVNEFTDKTDRSTILTERAPETTSVQELDLTEEDIAKANDDIRNARQQHQLGDYEKCITTISEAIKTVNDSHQYKDLLLAYSIRSAAYARLQKYQNALKDANRVIELDPMYPKGYYRKALALAHLFKSKDCTMDQLTSAATVALHFSPSLKTDSVFNELFPADKYSFSAMVVNTSHDLNRISMIEKGTIIMMPGIYTMPIEPTVPVNIVGIGMVELKSDIYPSLILCPGSRCFVENLLISGVTSSVVVTNPTSYVYFVNCRFRSEYIGYPSLSIEGEARLDKCHLLGSKGGGILYAGKQAFGSVKNTTIHCDYAAFEVRDGAAASVSNSVFSCCKQGALIWKGAHDVAITSCKIFNCSMEGILLDCAQRVTVRKTKIYANKNYGLTIQSGCDTITIENNQFYRNLFWAITANGVSNVIIANNKIYENKSGGIRNGINNKNIIIKQNHIYDNAGAGKYFNCNHS
jgi:tetratricopeptide (TPR) repeat protein